MLVVALGPFSSVLILAVHVCWTLLVVPFVLVGLACFCIYLFGWLESWVLVVIGWSCHPSGSFFILCEKKLLGLVAKRFFHVIIC